MKVLGEAEWNIMESLWESSPKVGSQITADMAVRTGWSRSTTLTMLKRMCEKGLIACEEKGRMRAYIPLIARDTAVKRDGEFSEAGIPRQHQYAGKLFCGKTEAEPGGIG